MSHAHSVGSIPKPGPHHSETKTSNVRNSVILQKSPSAHFTLQAQATGDTEIDRVAQALYVETSGLNQLDIFAGLGRYKDACARGINLHSTPGVGFLAICTHFLRRAL